MRVSGDDVHGHFEIVDDPGQGNLTALFEKAFMNWRARIQCTVQVVRTVRFLCRGAGAGRRGRCGCSRNSVLVEGARGGLMRWCLPANVDCAVCDTLR